MGSKQFCLKWSHHQRNMLSNFGDLLNHEAFVDVTLACEGVCLKAHKVVLSACSPYFQKILIENPCQHPVVILQNIKCDEMQAILSFMYKGEMNVSQEQVSAILKIAEGLKIKGLTDVANEDFQTLHRKGVKPTVIFVPAEGQPSPPAKRKKKAASRTIGEPSQLPESDLELHLLPRPVLLPEQNITLSIQSSSYNASDSNSVSMRLEKEETVNVAPAFESVDHGPSTSRDKPPMHDLLGFMESSFVEIERETSSQQVSQNSSLDFSYIKSTRGGDFVVRYGYLFKLNKTGPGGKRYYRCYRDSKTGCKARAIISGGQITDVEGHNHETDDHEIAKREYKMLAMRSIMEEPMYPIEDYHNQACQESILRNMKQEMENSIPTSRDTDLVGDENQEEYHMERHSNISKLSSEESWYDSLSKQNSHLGKSTVGAS